MRQLVEQHADFVRRFLTQFISDPVEVEDLCQDTFIAMFRNLASYRHESRFSTWLLGISRNLALTHLRDQSRRRRREGRVMTALTQQWQSEQLQRGSDDAHIERMDLLQECLESLAPKARDLVQRFYFENASAQQIAEEAGRKSGSIRMTLLRIRKGLRECIESKQRDDGHE